LVDVLGLSFQVRLENCADARIGGDKAKTFGEDEDLVAGDVVLPVKM
jgi:hypothetical protein